MKYLKYNLITQGEKGEEIKGAAVSLAYSEANLALARAEAWQGEIAVEEDGRPEPELTQEQRIAELEAALELLLTGVTE